MSLRRTPWQKQPDNSWKKLSTSTTHQENTNYEDKLAFIWNINDSIAGFDKQGCMIACHVGEQPANSGFGSKYTAKVSLILPTFNEASNLPYVLPFRSCVRI